MARNPTVRQKVLDAAIAIVDEVGTADLRIADVCEAAHVSPPIIYRHFDSRSGLVDAVQLERYSRELNRDIEAFQAAAATCRSVADVDKMVRSFSAMLADRRIQARWTRLNVIGTAYANDVLMAQVFEKQDTLVQAVAGCFKGLQERGLVRGDLDVDSFANWLHALLLSRVFVEHGSQVGSLGTWNNLTADAIVALILD